MRRGSGVKKKEVRHLEPVCKIVAKTVAEIGISSSLVNVSRLAAQIGSDVVNRTLPCLEINEYVKLFGDSPVGNFTRLTMTGVNEDFCVLDDYDQRKVNDHFAAKAGENIKEICGSPKVRDRCKRLKSTSQCVMELLETNIANGKCDTIVAEMEGMEPMKQMGGM
ncbi:hypothetical protein AVEN_73357-1 [Araneus ventricosus]|uniref:Uncharacterized protein n=1 Tax=Araneus ventricosus TaxID=182803 RepID=A0A4Y2J373_ARAVE|nr:hypothetical protein AVEN_73357-1 [Araneus ventricosus]